MNFTNDWNDIWKHFMMNFYGCHNVNFLGNTTFVVYNHNALETSKKNESINMCTNSFFKLKKTHTKHQYSIQVDFAS
jgi:hypothetical protein